jgi:hypothetical protein
MNKCTFVLSPAGGYRCSICYFESDVIIDRNCAGKIALNYSRIQNRKDCGCNQKGNSAVTDKNVE